MSNEKSDGEFLLSTEEQSIPKDQRLPCWWEHYLGEGAGGLMKLSNLNLWRKLFFSLSTCGKCLIHRTRCCWKTLIARRFFLSLSWSSSETHPTSARSALCNSYDHDLFNMATLKDRDHPPHDSCWRLHIKNCFTSSLHDIVFRCLAFLALHFCMSDFVAILKMPKPAIDINTPWETRPISWFQPLHHLWTPIFPLPKWDFCFETSSLN